MSQSILAGPPNISRYTYIVDSWFSNESCLFIHRADLLEKSVWYFVSTKRSASLRQMYIVH